MHIDFHDETNIVTEEYVDLIERLLTYAANQENLPTNTELSVSFVDNHEIQILNRNYRQLDKPTDVLSFALEDEVDGEVAITGHDLPLILGDIVISVDKTREQANDYKHSFEREIGFLALHGFLHLLGYDHIEEDDEQKMVSRQKEILDGFGLPR
ncbi:metal-binding heat shock protein [Gracilibacillus halophilus YIM-C55.5]|uniref:Endoribonuclease YbeY n=1 Tax=Gracilibacillus halophilus YIM-C55.5 TaxID=1308866 RepID=N4WT34_9BACI|nr:rRNA maturation RNase YbeY [Gracilibacillus halophilus]ENH97505.1 metal-binding heat shock protein [Gracilibacillus halophilus YIM-C55.5]